MGVFSVSAKVHNGDESLLEDLLDKFLDYLYASHFDETDSVGGTNDETMEFNFYGIRPPRGQDVSEELAEELMAWFDQFPNVGDVRVEIDIDPSWDIPAE